MTEVASPAADDDTDGLEAGDENPYLPWCRSVPSSLGGHSCVLMALVVGLVLRFLHLGYQSLWFDELLTATAATSSTLGELFSNHLVRHTHPPGYGLFLFGWVRLAGDSELALRLPSAISGVAAVLLFHRFACRQWPRETARNGTILMALTFPGLYYSHEARPYTFLLLVSVASTGIWLDLVSTLHRSQPIPRRQLAGYGLVCLLAIYTHYFGLALVAFQGMALIWLARRHGLSLRDGLILASLLIGSFIPWLGVMTRTASGYWGAEQAGRPGLVWLAHWGGWLLFNKMLVGAVVMFLLLLLPAWRCRAQVRERFRSSLSGQAELEPRLRWTIYLATIPLLCLMAISQHTNILGHRFLIILCPAIYLLMGFWIAHVFRRPSSGHRVTLLLCLLALAIEVPKYCKPKKEQWREAALHAIASSSEGDRFASFTFPELFEHYFRQAGRPGILERVGTSEEDLLSHARKLKKAGVGRLFILRAREPEMAAGTEERLRELSLRAIHTEFQKATVYQFDLSEPGGVIPPLGQHD